MRTSPGQNLLEAVIAIGVIMAAVLGSSSLIISTITAGQVSQNRVVAANFAREGIELVRSMRDSNWLKIEQNEKVGGALPVWNTGLPAASYILKYTASSTSASWSLVSCGACSGTSTTIYKTTNATYGDRIMYNQYLTNGDCQAANGLTGCSPSNYNRVITLELKDDDIGLGTDNPKYLLVTSRVDWKARTNPKSLTAQVRLYDWK